MIRSTSFRGLPVFGVSRPLAGSIYSAAVVIPLPRRADRPEAFRWFLGRLRGSISPDAVAALASAIQTQEGYYPGSVAFQNNNPGNLVYAGQPGASRGAGGFARFSSYNAGLSALYGQITLDATRGTDVNGNPTTTMSELLTSWAPPAENDTAGYIASVSAQTGYDPNAPLSSLGAPGVTAPLPDMTADSVSGDLADMVGLDSTVDLSAIGLPSAVPTLALAGAAIALLLVSRLF